MEYIAACLHTNISTGTIQYLWTCAPTGSVKVNSNKITKLSAKLLNFKFVYREFHIPFFYVYSLFFSILTHCLFIFTHCFFLYLLIVFFYIYSLFFFLYLLIVFFLYLLIVIFLYLLIVFYLYSLDR